MKFIQNMFVALALAIPVYIMVCGLMIARQRANWSNKTVTDVMFSSVAEAYTSPAFPLK